MGRATADVTITARGGAELGRLPAFGISPGWAVNDVGLFSCQVPRDAYLDAGFPGKDGLFRWLSWAHPTAGTWAGQIVTERWTGGAVELSAESWLSLLRRRRTARTYRSVTANAGHIFARLVRDVAHDDPTWLRPPRVDGDGDPLTVEWRADDALDVALGLAEESGMQLVVTADRVPEMRTRAGRDLTTTVLLADGHGGCIVGEPDWVRDGWSVENDILAVAGDRDFEEAAAYVVEDGDSIRRYGRRQGTRVYPGLVNKNTLEARARRDLVRSAVPASTLDLTITDENGVWATFREGDSVRVMLGSASAVLAAQVMVRTVDLDAGTMRLALRVDREISR